VQKSDSNLEPQTTLKFGHCNDISNKLFSKPFLYVCPDDTKESLRGNFPYLDSTNLKFLVEKEKRFIDLISIVFFTSDQSKCHQSQQVRTNRFLINESRWLTNEFQTEPTRNFHGCRMKVALTKNNAPYFDYIEHDNGSLETKGLYVDIVKAASKTFNFSIMNTIDAKLAHNRAAYYIDVNFDKSGYGSGKATDYIIYKNFLFLMPSGELYSDAAKLFMPLELEVWIATIVTILIALLTIQIVYRLSQRVQNFVFGRNVTTPSLNIMTAFVGGAQTTLPGRSFARFLLMLFIMFSLIIRTCHQSKLFTYLQADIIKKEIQTINELIEQNEILYIPKDLPERFTITQRFEKFVKYDLKDSKRFIERTIEPGFQGAVLTDDMVLTDIESKFMSGATSLKVLKETELGTFTKLTLERDNFLKEQIYDVIGRLHSAGLIDYWYQRMLKFKNKPKEEPEPTQLTMDHLKAGFVVSLSSLYRCHDMNSFLLYILVVLHSVAACFHRIWL